MSGRLGKKAKGEVRLPGEIIYEILLRLPISSLLRCREVCKSWNSQVKSSSFILDHLKSTLLIQSNKKKDDLLLLHARRKKEGSSWGVGWFFMLDCDNFDDEYTKRRVIPTPEFFKAVSSIYGVRENIDLDQPVGVVHVGACNGLICLVIMKIPVIIPMIWNPSVRKFLILPNQRLPDNEIGFPVYHFGYDSRTSDLKFVQVRVSHPESPCTFHIYSLLTGSWKNLSVPEEFVPFLYDKPVKTNDALHWICGRPYTKISESTIIVTFNLSSELFGKMKIPESLKTDSPMRSCYKLRYKSFALWSQSYCRTENYLGDLWVMKEYGVAESWTKLLTINMPYSLGSQKIYIRKSGQVVLAGTNYSSYLQGVQSLDPKSKQVKNIVDDRHLISFMDPFVESLVLLDRSDAFSY